jgi:alanine racemase
MQKIRAKIQLKNIRNNAEFFKRTTGVKLCAVVKANAYGHGAEEVTAALCHIADCFAVAIVEEGLSIRAAACGKEILVFTPPIDENQAFYIISGGLVGTVTDLKTAKLFVRVCETYQLRAKVHLKVNTGMNRHGMCLSTLRRVCQYLKTSPCVQVIGVYSHIFAPAYAEKQRRAFLQAERLCRSYFPNVCAHLSATYGSLLGEGFAFDMVRVGIGLYGYLPDEAKSLLAKNPLKKSMKIYAQVIKSRVYHGGGAGYGEKHALQIGDKYTLVRLGYADGALRTKNNGFLGENVNNLCMDAGLKRGNQQRGKWLCVMSDADEVARQTGTISYEVLCAATRRAEFVYEYK